LVESVDPLAQKDTRSYVADLTRLSCGTSELIKSALIQLQKALWPLLDESSSNAMNLKKLLTK
jgi:hypothetical protein